MRLLGCQQSQILSEIDFGHRTAEEEADSLREYFVKTIQWQSVFSGEVDIVYGAKGSGKSAIYSLLLGHEKELSERGVRVLAAENPRGATVFSELMVDPPVGEQGFRSLWKLYFLCLVGHFLRSLNPLPDPGQHVLRTLEEAHLLPREATLSGMLRSVLDYIRGVESVGLGLELDKTTGVPSGILGKISLREPTATLRDAGHISVDELLKQADIALEKARIRLWLLLDRLDVAFPDSPALEGNAMRALFRVYLDLVGMKALDLKIFLRTDIWSRISYSGTQAFPEASHISRHTTISWSSQSLLNLLIRRFLHNEIVKKTYNVDPSIVLGDTAKQMDLFARIFPPQANLDWILSHLRDGTRKSAPRELIHFLHCAKNIQSRKLELGGIEPGKETLFDVTSLRQSLPEVSTTRFELTLCAEYPLLRQYLVRLKGESTQFTLQALANLWHVAVEEATTITDSLLEVGFFEKKGERDRP